MPSRPVSTSQFAANRRNATKSTGPRSRAGKIRSSRNALRHGHYSGSGGYARLVAATMQDLGEDAAQFSRLLESLMEDWQPQGISQTLLVEDLASLRWERQREPGNRHSRASGNDSAFAGMTVKEPTDYESPTPS
ncbi:MAG: hypothetical protein ACRD3T_18585 [Terriglobia bacterium]